MGMNNDALQLMTQAYDLYLTRKDILKHDYDRREFIAFIDSYTHLLKKVGQSARAREIAVEINKLVIKEECPENLNLKGI